MKKVQEISDGDNRQSLVNMVKTGTEVEAVASELSANPGDQFFDTDRDIGLISIRNYWCLSRNLFNGASFTAPIPQGQQGGQDDTASAETTFKGGLFIPPYDIVFDKLSIWVAGESNGDANFSIYQRINGAGSFGLIGYAIDRLIDQDDRQEVLITPYEQGLSGNCHVFGGCEVIVMFGKGSNGNNFTLDTYRADSASTINIDVGDTEVPTNFTTNINSNVSIPPILQDFTVGGGDVIPAGASDETPIVKFGNSTLDLRNRNYGNQLAKANAKLTSEQLAFWEAHQEEYAKKDEVLRQARRAKKS